MYYEYPNILYTIPLTCFIAYVLMVIGRKKFLKKIYRFRHTMTRYVLEEFKRKRDRKWFINVVATFIIVSLFTVSMTMPYTMTKQYVVAEQKVETMLSLRRKIPVVVALDTSGSMYGEKIYYAVETVKMYIDAVIDKALVGFISFSDYVKVVVPPTSNKYLLYEKLSSVKPGGGTIYSEPLKTAYSWLVPYAEFNLSPSIIFVTDGLPFAGDIPVYRDVVYKCALKNITIYPIFIESPESSKYEKKVARMRLKEMADITNGELYTVENIKNLIDIFKKLIEETISRAGNYTLATKVKYPVDVKSYIAQPYIALVFVALVVYSVLRSLLYRITL